jgi:peptidoglycan/xylan/chitin deacetylase (PgdA/CDA1 family)
MLMDTELVGAGLGFASAASGMAWAVRGKSSQVFGPSVWRGESSRKSVAVTFDDGPSESTPALLDLLQRFGARATFFMCGKNVLRLTSIAREVASAGHQIGNHTENHPRLDFKSRRFMYNEISRAQQSIYRATGVTPQWFRPPYGVRWFGLRGVQKRLKLTGVMWTTIGHDWRWDGPRVARLMIRSASNGAILCLHDGRALVESPDIRSTLDAVEYFVPKLQDQGYKFETVSEILCPTVSRPKMSFRA